MEMANEAGMKEKAILAITAAEKASRSYKFTNQFRRFDTFLGIH